MVDFIIFAKEPDFKVLYVDVVVKLSKCCCVAMQEEAELTLLASPFPKRIGP